MKGKLTVMDIGEIVDEDGTVWLSFLDDEAEPYGTKTYGDALYFAVMVVNAYNKKLEDAE